MRLHEQSTLRLREQSTLRLCEFIQETHAFMALRNDLARQLAYVWGQGETQQVYYSYFTVLAPKSRGAVTNLHAHK